MKKKLFLVLMMFSLFMFIGSVKAEGTDSIYCNEEVIIGDNIVCTVTVSENRTIDADSKYLSFGGITGEGNSQGTGVSANFVANGKVTFATIKTGTAVINLKNGDGEVIKSATITISPKPTTTTTTVSKSSNVYLKSITIDGDAIEDFKKTKNSYEVEVPNDTEKVTVEAEAEDSKSTVDVDGPKKLSVGDNEYTIVVTAEDKSVKTYKVIITRKEEDKSTITKLKNISIKGYKINFDSSSKTFYVKVNKNTTDLDITVTTKDSNANYKITGNEYLEDGSVIKINVTAEDGKTTDTYRIIIQKDTTSIMPYILGGIGALVIILAIIILVIRKKNQKKRATKKIAPKNDDKSYEKETEDTKVVATDKTIEMKAINEAVKAKEVDSDDTNFDDEYNKVRKEEEEDDSEFDITEEVIDNDEDERTRLFTYDEEDEITSNDTDYDKLNNAIDEELGKTLSLRKEDYDDDYDNDEY